MLSIRLSLNFPSFEGYIFVFFPCFKKGTVFVFFPCFKKGTVYVFLPCFKKGQRFFFLFCQWRIEANNNINKFFFAVMLT